MRILFAYFDFTESNDPLRFRSIGECGLNFSTEHDYEVKKTHGESEVETDWKYIVTRAAKPEDERIPKGFWGERIYNVTAIVGANGSGKSTILHSMIRTVVEGLDPGVPFLLILQLTSSENLCLYCSRHGFEWQGPEELQVNYYTEYPEALKYTKTMLLDNTLTTSALDLGREYKIYDQIETLKDDDSSFIPYPEEVKQFYNKSLSASIAYSIERSTGQPKDHAIMPIAEAIATHFRYETYQETRYLFDRYQQDILSELNGERDAKETDGARFSVPEPRKLDVFILKPWNMYELHKKYYSIPSFLPRICASLQRGGLIGVLLADALINLLLVASKTSLGGSFIELYNRDTSASDGASTLDVQILLEQIQVLLDQVNATVNWNSPDIENLIELYSNTKQYVILLREHLKELTSVFEPVNLSDVYFESKDDSSPYLTFRIDMRNTIENDENLRFMINFLDRYRLVSNPYYYLVFSSGMSSGEKSFLRMLTQFRYALDGPPVYPKDSTIDNTANRLMNEFPSRRKLPCDTLFLFLDEADSTYHPEWQRLFISKLTTVLPLMFRDPYNRDSNDPSGCKDIQVVLATHSPLMMGDFPKACINYLYSENQTALAATHMSLHSTFGENLYIILKDSFFMEKTMGEFARKRVAEAAKWCGRMRKGHGGWSSESKNEYYSILAEFDGHYRTVQLLPNGIIKSKLIAELEDCAAMLGIELPGEIRSQKKRMAKRIEELEKELEQKNKVLKEAGLL